MDYCSQTFCTDLDNLKSLTYSASGLPAWLSFDNLTLTFSGIPADIDDGRLSTWPRATPNRPPCRASSSASPRSPHRRSNRRSASSFTPATPPCPPCFFLAPGSALATVVPALRVPASWSFSIGLDGNTCVAENDLFCGALQTNGTPLLPWITFDASEVTFDGIAPSDLAVSTPLVVEIELHCTNQERYSADSLAFNLVVASNEMSAYSTLPTVNVMMSSPADFTGVLIDGQPMQPANLSVLSIEVSYYKDWLRYDPATKTLSGSPPRNFTPAEGGKPALPVTLTSNFDQTLYTSVSLDLVPSYFSTSDSGTIQTNPGRTLHFDLTKYFANASASWQTDANLSASFNVLRAYMAILGCPVSFRCSTNF